MFALKMYSMILRSYIELLKMRLSSSVVFSAIAGYLLAISEKNPHDPIVLSKLIIGGFFIGGFCGVSVFLPKHPEIVF